MNKGLINDVVSNEKKKRYAVVISILVLMICITGSTYAYFALTASNNSITGTVGGGSLSLTVSKVFPTNNNSNMIPQLESTLGDAISDEYSCVDDNGNVICQVYSATVQNVGSTSAELSGTISFTGIDNMPNLKWMRITDSRTIGEYDSYTATTSGTLFEEGRVFNANGSATYYFVIWIDEIGETQTDNGTFRAIINFDSSTGGLSSTVRPLLTTYINDLYNEGELSDYNYISVKDISTEATQNTKQNIMLDNNEEYRYYGASPNNYVSFNGELWRIISSSNIKSSESDTTGSQRVRLIRDKSIGNHSWNFVEDINWESSTLKTTLNSIYYNSTSGTCFLGGNSTTCDYENGEIKGLSSEARNLIDNALWYLEGYNNSSTYVWANDWYAIERGTDTSPSWTGKVGLMYPSDYAYATDLSKCTTSATNYYSDATNCLETDWLYNGEIKQWTITRYIGDYYVYYIDTSGKIDYNTGYFYYTRRELGVRPVVVLKPNVKITGGTGTSGYPYQLSL